MKHAAYLKVVQIQKRKRDNFPNDFKHVANVCRLIHLLLSKRKVPSND